MRKPTAFLLTLLLLTGCSAAPAEAPQQVNDAAAPTMAAAALPISREAEELRFVVEKETYEDSARAEDDTLLARYRFDLPSLQVLREDGSVLEEAKIPDEEDALVSAAAFNERFGKWAAAEEFDEVVVAAREDLAFCRAEEMDWFNGYVLELDTAVYQTEHLVSVSGLYYSYTGGAHPNTWQLGWNFDLERGSFFGPEELGEDSAEFQEGVHQELIRQAKITALEKGLAPEEFFWEDYQEILANWVSYAVYFDESGMTVAFSPYELAAYVAGPQIFHMAYDWLKPHLSQHGCEVLGLTE